MELVRIVSLGCGSTTCPTVYAADDGDLVVQGYKINEPRIEEGLPEGEAVVKIPRQLLDDWVHATGGR